MVGTQHLLPDRQRALQQWPRTRVVAHHRVHRRKIGEDSPDVRMVRSQRLLPDRQRPLVEGTRLGELPRRQVGARQHIETPGNLGMIATEMFFLRPEQRW
jgi:hypothetical protein